MAARPIASLTISFGMVSIPVRLYSATEASGAISFHLLHKSCGSRLRRQYFCARENVPVSREEMAKGYEFAKDRYVLFTAEELKALEEAGTQVAEITEFLSAGAIDPVFYDKAYYLGPDKGGAKPYALLARALKETGRCALGRWAAHGKQYLVLIRPVASGLVEGLAMHQLFYSSEVRSIGDIDIPKIEVKPAELQLAQQLIEQQAADKFDPAAYADAVRARIEAAIRRKVAGQEITLPEAPQPQTKVIDLMEALRASLEKKPAKKSERAEAQAREAARKAR